MSSTEGFTKPQVRGHLHLAATMARQDPDSYEARLGAVSCAGDLDDLFYSQFENPLDYPFENPLYIDYLFRLSRMIYYENHWLGGKPNIPVVFLQWPEVSACSVIMGDVKGADCSGTSWFSWWFWIWKMCVPRDFTWFYTWNTSTSSHFMLFDSNM